MSLFDLLMNIDRRWIYITILLGVFIPLLVTLNLPIKVNPEVESVYDRIDELKPGSVVFLALEYDPATRPELEPMAKGVMRHIFSHNLKVISTGLFQLGTALVEQHLREIANEFNKKYGIDYVFLGYKPYPGLVILNMGQDFRIPFPRDYYNNLTDSLPMMQGLHNYSNCAMVVSINATSGADYWVWYANGRYKAPLALGVTAVMATDYYSYLQSGQIFGLMGGLRGAAEYEVLLRSRERLQFTSMAMRAMDVQSITHLVIVLFIVVGNIGYFVSRKRETRTK